VVFLGEWWLLNTLALGVVIRPDQAAAAGPAPG
jgi:hypothetical protein